MKQVQCELVWAFKNNPSHRGVTVDGIFGADTVRAVKELQTCSRITSDGIVGPATWIKLDYYSSYCVIAGWPGC